MSLEDVDILSIIFNSLHFCINHSENIQINCEDFLSGSTYDGVIIHRLKLEFFLVVVDFCSSIHVAAFICRIRQMTTRMMNAVPSRVQTEGAGEDAPL